jgi:hypothetical protein
LLRQIIRADVEGSLADFFVFAVPLAAAAAAAGGGLVSIVGLPLPFAGASGWAGFFLRAMVYAGDVP